MMSDALRKLLSEMTVPAALTAALDATDMPEAIDPGQVWRVRWDDRALLVLLTAVTDHAVTGACVTLTEQTPTGSQVPVLPFASEVLPGAVVWPGTNTELPRRVLERLLERSEATVAVAAEVEVTQNAEVDIFDEGLEIQARLMDELLDLAGAPELPVQDDSTSTLGEKLGGDARASLQLLVDVLGVPQNVALALYRGKEEPTPEQTTTLVSAGLLAEAPDMAFPSAIVIELDQPWHKAAVLAKAAEHGRGEYETRCLAAKEAYALAARITAHEDSIRARVARALDSL